MIPAIDYVKPRSLSEALQILSDPQAQAKILAGGTDILPGFHINSRRFREVKTLVDISGLDELRGIRMADDGLHLGAAVTFTDVVKNDDIRQQYPLLSQAAVQVGSVQIRNRATLTGNFVNNAPCADSVPPLLVYDAEIKIRSLKGERRLPLREFLIKPYRTQLQPDEMVTEIFLPPPPAGFEGAFYKLGRRRAVAISRITLALLVKLNDGVIEDIRDVVFAAERSAQIRLLNAHLDQRPSQRGRHDFAGGKRILNTAHDVHAFVAFPRNSDYRLRLDVGMLDKGRSVRLL